MRKELASVGLLVLSFIPAPSFSHGNEKYSACELSRIVNGTYGGKAENAIFYCWDPNDPDAGIGIPGIPDMEPMEMPSMEPMEMPEGPMEMRGIPSIEPTEMPSFEPPSYQPSRCSQLDMRIQENKIRCSPGGDLY